MWAMFGGWFPAGWLVGDVAHSGVAVDHETCATEGIGGKGPGTRRGCRTREHESVCSVFEVVVERKCSKERPIVVVRDKEAGP
jgi:hypothetical protein